jgi:hypothetical protein
VGVERLAIRKEPRRPAIGYDAVAAEQVQRPWDGLATFGGAERFWRAPGGARLFWVMTLTLIMTAPPHSTSTAYRSLFRWLLNSVAGLCNGNDPDWRCYICGTEERCIGLVIGEILIDAPERVLG